MRIYVSHASSFDYIDGLYNPLTKLFREHELFLPHEPINLDKRAEDMLPTCDLLIAEVSHPSTGQGIELGTAYMLKIPIICIYKTDTHYSNSIKFVTDQIYSYTDLSEIANYLPS